MKKMLSFLIVTLLICNLSIAQNVEVSIQRGHSGLVMDAAFSNDGKYLLTAGGKSAILWEVKTGKQIREFIERNDVKAVAFSSDNLHVIVFTSIGTITWWEIISGKEYKRYPDNDDSVSKVKKIASGKYIASSRDKSIVVNDIETGSKIFELPAIDTANQWIANFYLSNDLQTAYVSTSSSSSPKLAYYSGTKKIVSIKTAVLNEICAFKEANELFACSFPNKKLYCFTMDSLKKKYEIALSGKYNYLDISSNRKYAALYSSDGAPTLVYDLEKKELLTELKNYKRVTLVKFLGNNKLLVGSNNLSLIEIPSGRLITSFNSSVESIYKLLVSNDEKMVVTQSRDWLTFWNSSTGRIINWYGNFSTPINSAAIDKISNKVFVTLRDSSIDVINGKNLELVKNKIPMNPNVIDISPDGKTMAVTSDVSTDQFVGLFSIGNNIQFDKKFDYKWISKIVFHPSEKVLAMPTGNALDFSLSVMDYNGRVLWSALQGTAAYGLSWSRDGSMIACCGTNNKVTTYSFDGKELFSYKAPAQLQSCYISDDKKSVFIGLDQFGDFSRDIYQVDFNSQIKCYKGHIDQINDLTTLKNGNTLASVSSDGSLKIWDTSNQKEIASLYAFHNGEFATLTPDGYYSVSRGASESVAFVQGLRAFSFENFDLIFNRPDIITERLGGSPELVAAYRSAYQKRLRRAGFKEDQLKQNRHLPEVISVAPSLPIETKDSILTLNVSLKDTLYYLNRLMVYVNNVPVYGSKGIPLNQTQLNEVTKQIKVPLLPGTNKIQFSVFNESGVESIRETYDTRCIAKMAKPNLYLLTIGVSKFKDTTYNLTYAAKDASDVEQLFKKNNTRYKQVKTYNFSNEHAVKSEILNVRSILEKVRPQDVVMVFAATHGLLSDKFDYYLATHDIDFNNPSTNGLAYEDLESLLDGIPSLKKAVFIDACHSGEVDKEESKLVADATGQIKEVSSRGFIKVVTTSQQSIGLKSSFDLMQELFSDLERGSGSVVVSSASGKEYAYESSEWKNGVFTFAFLEGLRTGSADLNHDGEISVAEIKDYVTKKVLYLTQGKQTPTSRRDNQEFDFTLY